jgi:hypothetical protein
MGSPLHHSITLPPHGSETLIKYDIAYSDGSMSIGDYRGGWFTITIPYGGGKGTITSSPKGLIDMPLPPKVIKH